MNLLKKVKHKKLIIENDYDLDEIVRKYGKTGDEIEEYISGEVNHEKTQIIRKFTCVENLGTQETTKAEYEANINDSRYNIYSFGSEISYAFTDFESSEISKEEYFAQDKFSEFHYFTELNYKDFLDDFDLQAFDYFFENVLVKWCYESFSSIEKIIADSSKIKGKMILDAVFKKIIKSNNFLENFRLESKTNNIQREICSYLISYNNILLTNIKNRFKLIFPSVIKNIPNEVKKAREKKVLEDILFACGKMQDNKIFNDSQDENARTKQVLDILSKHYKTSDQSQIGNSSTGKKAGSLDGIIGDKKLNEYYIEALNLSYIDKKYITSHINKLEKNYDNKGLLVKFVLVYCNVDDGKFFEFTVNYKNFLNIDLVYNYQLIGESEEVLNDLKYTNQKIFKTCHMRENHKVYLYHVLLKFPKDKLTIV
ncbi:hypothetical protein RT99_10095 [Flavobacterium sp. MEB061]|uniref:hypothetical protein n=1 Tax=Flavobacterium sp. MEB061 TaxID=1587524 RepID=UPI0005ACDAEA|nr:hypothetical protein [Flavobacterium sp. MEB061]KIQ21766.1 hypothetical protein RT99_10095 [Flavobacterium sp. MEB061]